MVGGFSFKGVDIDQLGLTYAPQLSQIYVYNSNYKLSEQSFQSHKGAYYYGKTTSAKQFTLRCIFQGHHANNGFIDRLTKFFQIGTSGKLVFEKRPWLYYTATVTSIDFTRLTNRQAGYITIGMKAYYPYGRCQGVSVQNQVYKYMTDQNKAHYSSAQLANIQAFDDAFSIENVKNNTGMLSVEHTPGTLLRGKSNITSSTSILLYNAGSQPADVAVTVAGDVGDGVVIENKTTGQQCEVILLNNSSAFPGLNEGIASITCDSMNGKVVATSNITGTKKLSFLHHAGGFITLSPAYPIKRSVTITNATTPIEQAKGNYIESPDASFTEQDVGKYFFFVTSVGDVWAKIIEVKSKTQAAINMQTPTIRNPIKTDIVTMNEITVRPKNPGGTMKLSYVDFNYKPTFS